MNIHFFRYSSLEFTLYISYNYIVQKNNVRFVDDITKQNHELMKRMRDSNRFDSVWFYNCGIYGRTPDDKQFTFGLYDDIDIKIRQRR